MKHIITIVAFTLLCVRLSGQVGSTTRQDLLWLVYFNKLELSPKWYMFSEVQERRFIHPSRRHQFLLRGHLHYRFHPEWDVSAGFTYFLQSPHDPHSTSTLVVPELRPHVQLDGAQKLSMRWSLRHRYRLESRHFRNTDEGELVPGYEQWYRFRYRLQASYRLVKLNEQWLRLLASNELHVNFGEKVGVNRFDQNRIYAGASYEISPQFVVEAGYMHWYQQRRSGVDFYARDILRINLTHRLKLRKERESNES
jgi:hypothetical protein